LFASLVIAPSVPPIQREKHSFAPDCQKSKNGSIGGFICLPGANGDTLLRISLKIDHGAAP
jgi:hypothetical protein